MLCRLGATLFLLQLLPATVSFASDSPLTHTELTPVVVTGAMVACRIIPQASGPASLAEVATRPVCIQRVPVSLCAASTPWPISGAVDVKPVTECEQDDCVLDASVDTGVNCAGLSIQPRYPRARESLEARH